MCYFPRGARGLFSSGVLRPPGPQRAHGFDDRVLRSILGWDGLVTTACGEAGGLGVGKLGAGNLLRSFPGSPTDLLETCFACFWACGMPRFYSTDLLGALPKPTQFLADLVLSRKSIAAYMHPSAIYA